MVERKPSSAVRVEPVWQCDADEPSWCVDATIPGCSIGEREVSTMPPGERRAIRLTRARERAQAVLAVPEERPRRERRVVALISVSVALHVLGFVLLAWFGEGLETRIPHRGREAFTNERVIVPIDVPAREVEPEPEPEFVPMDSSAVAQARPRRPSPKPAPVPASPPASYALHGFQISSAGSLPAGSGEGEAWGSEAGQGHGAADAGSDAAPTGPAVAGPDVQAKPRGNPIEPDYPPELERRGIEGDVVVLVWLDEHGHVIKAEVVESSGYEAFDHNAVMAAQQQGWTPAMRGGEAIASKRRYRIRFKLPSR